MASSDRLTRYSARLLLDWLNQRFETRFDLSQAEGDALRAQPQDETFVASDGEVRPTFLPRSLPWAE